MCDVLIMAGKRDGHHVGRAQQRWWTTTSPVGRQDRLCRMGVTTHIDS